MKLEYIHKLQLVRIAAGISRRSPDFILWMILPAVCMSAGDILQIESTVSGAVSFRIEIADTVEARRHGLMYRESLAEDSGMLFDYKIPRRVSFWMKNTRIPLDILFIDATGRIIGIHRSAVPGSTALIHSPGKVRAVLEINAGLSERYAILPGDRVRHDIFRP